MAVRAAGLSSTTSIRAANFPLLGPTARGRKAPGRDGADKDIVSTRGLSVQYGVDGGDRRFLCGSSPGGCTTHLSSRNEEDYSSLGRRRLIAEINSLPLRDFSMKTPSPKRRAK